MGTDTRDDPRARYASLELHTDGSGAYGVDLCNMARPEGPGGDTDPARQMVSDEQLVVGVLSGLVRLAEHARDRAAAGGKALVRAVLIPAVSAQSLEIGHTRQFGFRETRSRATVGADQLVTAEAAVELDDLATPGPALVSTAALLVDEIGQDFGIPEFGQLSRDGELRQRYWSSGTWQAEMVAWAQQHGITCTDAVLR